MAKKKTKARGAKKTPNESVKEPVGFDDVDDFFFGSETGSFQRDEFDYDPFEDHASLSGRQSRIVCRTPRRRGLSGRRSRPPH